MKESIDISHNNHQTLTCFQTCIITCKYIIITKQHFPTYTNVYIISVLLFIWQDHLLEELDFISRPVFQPSLVRCIACKRAVHQQMRRRMEIIPYLNLLLTQIYILHIGIGESCQDDRVKQLL